MQQRWGSRVEVARGSLVGRVALRFVAASGYDRSLALAAQSFLALVPASILAVAYLPGAARRTAGAWLVDRFGLTGDAAAAVAHLVERPPGGADPGVLVGLVLVVVTGIGFTRTLQRVYVTAWVLPPMGVRGFLYGLVAVAVLLGAIAVTVTGQLPGSAWGAVAGVVVRVVGSVVLWWLVQRLLLGGLVGWRALLPGAVVVGLGQAGVMVLAELYLPRTITSQAQRFGAIGVAFALVSWLVILAYLLVGAAVLSAELAGAPDVGAGGGARSDAAVSPPEAGSPPEGGAGSGEDH